MSKEKPLVNKTLLLERIPGKGGWTYAVIHDVNPDPQNHFGWVRVKGSIDDHEFHHYHLQPMGNGRLFLPVKAEIRKKIKKQAGDKVKVILFRDDSPLEIPPELLECLQDEPSAMKVFKTWTRGQQKMAIDHIFSAKKTDTRALRILDLINTLLKRKP